MKNFIENRRKFHRINIDKQVDLELINDSYEQCRVKNISLGGMFVTGVFPKRKTSEYKVKLLRNKDDTKNPFFSASARIVWGNEDGAGLQFTSMTNDNYQRLLRTLINNAERPAIIIHEFPQNSPFEIRED